MHGLIYTLSRGMNPPLSEDSFKPAIARLQKLFSELPRTPFNCTKKSPFGDFIVETRGIAPLAYACTARSASYHAGAGKCFHRSHLLIRPFDPSIISITKENHPESQSGGFLCDGDEGDRTPDLLNAIQARSQLRHAPVTMIILTQNKQECNVQFC